MVAVLRTEQRAADRRGEEEASRINQISPAELRRIHTPKNYNPKPPCFHKIKIKHLTRMPWFFVLFCCVLMFKIEKNSESGSFTLGAAGGGGGHAMRLSSAPFFSQENRIPGLQRVPRPQLLLCATVLIGVPAILD